MPDEQLTVIALHNINPEPWRVGEASTVRRGPQGKLGAFIAPDPALVNYQEAVREELRNMRVPLLTPNYHLRFWWWREIITYESASGRKVTKNRVDQTNLQKATEDALQKCKETKNKKAFGGVITNDAYCVSSGGMIVEQDKNVKPMILIEIVSGATYGSGQPYPWPASLTPEGLDIFEVACSTGRSQWMTTDVPSSTSRQTKR